MTPSLKRAFAGLLLALSVLAPATADAGSLYIEKWKQWFDSSGNPCNGCLIYFYEVGTTTLKNTYSNEALSTPNTNPLVLNSAGRSATQVWFSGRYRVVVKSAAGVTITDDDPVEEFVPTSGIQNSSQVYCGSNSGSANTLTFTCSPALSAYSAGMTLRGRIVADNSSTVTVNFNSVGAKAVVNNDGEALASGDLQGPGIITLTYDSTTDAFRLQTPDAAALLTSATTGRAALTTGTHTVVVLASGMFSRTTNGAAGVLTELATNDVMLSSKDFDQTTSEGVQFYIPAPKSWNEGTITVQHGWTAASGSAAQTVIWSTACTAFSDDDAMDTAFSGAQTSTDALITANDLHISPVSAAITVAGTPAESDFLICQTTRDVADTLAADAKLLWTKVFLTISAGNDS